MKSLVPIIGLTLSTLTKGNINNYLNLTKEENFSFENDEILILGNQEINFNKFDYLSLNKDFLYFNLNASNDELKAFFYDYESNTSNQLRSDSINETKLINEINDFYNENNTKNKNFKVSSDNDFKRVLSGNLKEYKKPYGYFTYTYELSRYDFSEKSSLYHLSLTQYIVPGYIPYSLKENDYQDYSINFAATKVYVCQLEIETGYYESWKGGIPIFKDAYPLTKPNTVIITSSYSAGLTIGRSTEIGFNKGLYESEGFSFDASLSISYSKSYQKDEPKLSAQPGTKDGEFTRVYTYERSEKYSNDENLGYFFEMNNYQNGENVKNRVAIFVSGYMTLTKGLETKDVSASWNIF